MASYHQMGHDSKNLLKETGLSRFSGAILSPVNETMGEMARIVEHSPTETFEFIFDPQLYYPEYKKGCLTEWEYYPNDFDTADMSSLAYWRTLNKALVNTLGRLRPRAACSPAYVPRIFDNRYYERIIQIADDFQGRAAEINVETVFTLIVDLTELGQTSRVEEIASILTNHDFQRVFLVFNTEVRPREELSDLDAIKGAIRLIGFLRGAGINVMVGFTSSDLLLWKAAGANSCATGKFFNLRRFTKSRFKAPSEGGGQVGYWFEEGLVTFLREPDLIRIRKAGLLPDAGNRGNPFETTILDCLDNRPWLALSWRQFLHWFSSIEDRLSHEPNAALELLERAERRWRNIRTNIPMDENRNNGSWLPIWRRALGR